MSLKYKQAVLIQNLVDRNSAPIGQPALASLRATTELLVPKKTRITLTNTVVTVPFSSGEGNLQLLTLPDRYLVLLGININLVATKGNAVDGIVAATPVSCGLSTVSGTDNLVRTVTISDSTLTPHFELHTGGGNIQYPLDVEPETPVWLYTSSDGNPTADDTMTFSGTIDIFYFDLSKPGL